MAKHVLIDAVVTINSVTLTDRCKAISWIAKTNKVPAAAMSEVESYSMLADIFVEDITMEFYQDYAASNIYITLKALWAARSTFTITAKASSAADSATNPNFTVTAGVGSMPFISGTRGDAHLAPVTFIPCSAMTFDIT